MTYFESTYSYVSTTQISASADCLYAQIDIAEFRREFQRKTSSRDFVHTYYSIYNHDCNCYRVDCRTAVSNMCDQNNHDNNFNNTNNNMNNRSTRFY